MPRKLEEYSQESEYMEVAILSHERPTWIIILLLDACNRTYYGDVGRTYELEIRRPREDKLPFLCHLNFTAAGASYGDLVQLTFDTFTVGKFVSFTSEGCPDGHMSIREEGLPSPQGQWCGSAWGYTVYYSERASLNLTLRLDRLSQQGIGYNFDFKLAYKFLKRSEARLRYGNSSTSIWRGDPVPGTYCDRLLTNCDKRPCRIQSPNYPGVYPRNVTCLYKIEHTKIPPGKHALLAVRQTNSHKIHIKDQIVKYDRSQRVLKIWDQCNVVQDYLTVYDGGAPTSPVLVRLCGGDAVPDIISSGPRMLLEFHTSPFDNPFHPVPLSYLPGFELEVQVLFMDTSSHSYVREDGRCEFLLNTFDASSGILRNPRHSLPPNTTCRYHFQGRSNEIVWISFIKYYAASPDPAAFDQGTDCNAQLRIWDGRVIDGDAEDKNNASLLGEFCKEEVPRLCDHTLLSNSTRSTRPCSLLESYVTTGSEMTIEQVVRQGSALYPILFVIRYEFVDISQQGQPIRGSQSLCDRVFKSAPGIQSSSGRFQSPKSIFLYGRGGSQNMSCILRFEAGLGERIRLTFTKTAFGNKECYSYKDTRTGRWKCDRSYVRYQGVYPSSLGFAELKITEYPWPSIALPRDCICSNMTEPTVIHSLTASVVEVNLTITMMNITEDFNDFGFEGEYQFLPINSVDDNVCSTSWGERRLKGSSGEILLKNPQYDDSPLSEIIDTNIVSESVRSDDLAVDSCIHQPWLIEPVDSNMNYIYIKIQGFEVNQISASVCPTSNRILIYYALETDTPKEICPVPSIGYDKANFDVQTVELFSKGWKMKGDQSDSELILEPNSRSFVVEFIQREAGKYTVKWIEVSKRQAIGGSSSSYVSSMSSMPNVIQDCPYRCPELNACISATLWCDGVNHCPSSFDEEDSNCAFQFGIPFLYILIGAGAFCLLIIPIIFTMCIRFCQHKHREKKKIKAQMEANSSANNHLHVNHMHSNGTGIGRYPIPTADTYVSNEPNYGTSQKYATIDKYSMGSKYSTAERYGLNDARYNMADNRYDPHTDDRYMKDTPDLRYGGTLGRYGTHHNNTGSRYGSSKGVYVPSTEDMYIEGKDSFC